MSAEWDQGFNDAVTYCRANYKPFKPMSMPDEFAHRGSAWSRGFAEGCLTTKNKIIDEAHPGNVGFAVHGPGSVTIYYPKGHEKVKNKA